MRHMIFQGGSQLTTTAKGDKGLSKVSRSVLGEKEKRLYSKIYSYLNDTYELDEIALDQIAMAIVCQKLVILPKLFSGEEADFKEASEIVRKWLSEYRLTPKSKDKDKTLNVSLSALVEEIHRERGGNV